MHVNVSQFLIFFLGSIFVACNPPLTNFRKQYSFEALPALVYEKMPEKFGSVSESSQKICLTDFKAPLEKTTLSPSYQNNCSGCHGSSGKGSGDSPSLNTVNDLASFQAVIRSGRRFMPAFDGKLINDKDLESDFDLLKNKSNQLQDTPTLASVPVELAEITEEQYSTALKKGLVAWRTPGDRGACASCHGPDGIDLSRISYSNSSILRRAMGQNLDPKLSMDIVAMIDAQRNRFLISDPCNPETFRPLQPGLEIILGKSREEKDLSLLNHLKRYDVNLEEKVVESLESAKLLMESIKKLDVARIPVAIEFNRWAEDGFHGSEHKTTAEWLPELPLEPSSDENEVRWVNLQNDYLASYSDKDLWALLDGVSLLESKRFSDGGVGSRLAKEKYKSVLMMQHMFRKKSMTMPDLKMTDDLNRFSVWETAQIATVMARGCSDLGSKDAPFPCWEYPVSFFKKMGADSQALLKDLQKITLPWLAAGFMQDPPLQLTEGGDAQIQHLHDAFRQAALSESEDKGKESALYIHNIYFSFVRMVKSVESLDSQFPVGHSLSDKVVNGCWNMAGNGITQWALSTLPYLKLIGIADATKIKDLEYRDKIFKVLANINKMVMNLILEDLKNPVEVCKKLSNKDQLSKVIASIVSFEQEIDTYTGSALDLMGKEILKILK